MGRGLSELTPLFASLDFPARHVQRATLAAQAVRAPALRNVVMKREN